MNTNQPDPWAHDPEYCGTLDCPGCYAEMYVPRDQRTPAEFSVYLFNSGRMQETYDNGDRAEDTEVGIVRPLRSDGSRFWDDWESPE